MPRWLLILAALAPLWAATAAYAEDAVDRLVRLAVKAQLEDKHDQALDLYTQALADQALVTHRRAGLHSDRGVIYAQLGRIKDALDDFNESIKLFPENASVYNNRGSTLLAIGYDREAIKDFNRAILLAPGYAAAYLNRGSAYMTLKELPAGISDYNRAVRLEPENAMVLNARGVINLKNGRPNAAIRDFGKAIQANARLDSAYAQRAEARLRTGDAAAAVEDLTRAIVYAPQEVRFYLQRGHAYLQSSDPDAALRDFTKAIEMKEAAPEAYTARALTLAKQEDYEGALADLSRALELDQRSAESYAIRAFIYTRSGQLVLAERDLATAKRLNGRLIAVRWVEAEISEVQGARDAAVAQHRAILEEVPTYRFSQAALERLEIAKPFVAETAMDKHGLGEWRVVKTGPRYVARNDEFANLEVPLEPVGRATPRILDWQQRPAPHRRYGVLRYAAGSMKVSGKDVGIENAVVVDVNARRVLAAVPHVDGGRRAEWSWSETRLEITAADGLSDVVELDFKRPLPAVAHAGSPRRSRPQSYGGDVPSWVPWANNDPPPRRRQAQRQRRQKPKSLFEVIFGN